MPQFNTLGNITKSLGNPWYDERRFIGQVRDQYKIALSDGTPIADVGTNLLRANGRGVYAFVEYPGHPVDPEQAIYRDSFGRTRVNFYPASIGPDGAIAGTPHSNATCTVIEPDGREWAAPSASAVVLCGSGKIAWNPDGYVHSNFGVESKEPTYDFAVSPEGDLLYQRRDGALVLNERVIGAPSYNYYYLNVMRLGGRILVTWSPSQADTDGVVRSFSDAELLTLPVSPSPVVTPAPSPVPPPPVVPPPVNPSPKEPVMPVAPNRLDVVRSVIAAHPEIDRVTDGIRGAITALVVQALGGLPWGRKDRDRDPNNDNNSDDALCYRLADGSFEIYDILSGTDGSAQWDYKGTFADGANGYFREVSIVSTGGNGGSGGPSPSVPAGSVGQALDTKLAALQAVVDATKVSLDNLWSRFQALESRTVAPANVSLNLNGRRIGLRAMANGKFVCAEDQPNRPLLANRPDHGEWETFEIVE